MYIGPKASGETEEWMQTVFAKFPEFTAQLRKEEESRGYLGVYIERIGRNAAEMAIKKIRTQKDLEKFVEDMKKYWAKNL